MGDARKADPALIPDFSCQDPAEFYVGKGYLHVRSNYLLEIDNIMDLSHIEFLHPTTLGSSAVSNGKYTASQEGETVWSKRIMYGDVVPDALADAVGTPRGAVIDRWLDVRWNAPANMVLFGGAVASGRPQAESRSSSPTTHCFTPETDGTTHYWVGLCIPKKMGEAGARMAAENVKFLRAPFEQEDLPMLQAQHQSMADAELLSLSPLLLATDAGGVRARRILANLIANEQDAAREQHTAQPS